MATATDLLSQLRDIHLPAPPPAAPVWDLALAAVLTGLALALIAWTAWRRRPAWQIDAIRALREIDVTSPAYAEQARAELATVTRRIALALAPRQAVELTGDAYLRYLDELFCTNYFSSGPGQLLGDALYRPLLPNTNLVALRDALIGLVRAQPRRAANAVGVATT